MSKKLRNKIYSMSNSFLPLDMFYNDIENMSKYPSFSKELAFRDLEKIADFLLDLQSQLAEKDKIIKQLKLDLGMFKSVNEFINGYGIEKTREVLLQTEKTKNQDKISFCIEKLKSIKNELSNLIALRTNETFLIDGKKFRDYINNEIELTKKENKNV